MLLVFILVSMRVLPFEAAVFVAKTVIRAYLLLSPRARFQLKMAEETLAQGRLTKKDYVGRAAFNLALMSRMGTSLTRRLGVKIEGEEVIRDLRNRGSSAVVAMFHFGPWELLAEIFTLRGYRIAAIAGKQRMSIFDRYLAALRRRAGLVVYNDLKQALVALSGGTFLATLLDKTRRAKGASIGIPYEDYRVSVIPEKMAKRTGRDLVPVICRFEQRRLDVTIGSPDESLSDFFAPFFSRTPQDWLVWGE